MVSCTHSPARQEVGVWGPHGWALDFSAGEGQGPQGLGWAETKSQNGGPFLPPQIFRGLCRVGFGSATQATDHLGVRYRLVRELSTHR